MTPSAAEALFRSGKLPFLVATASILQISESMLPHPVPGLRFGLANIVTLIILVHYGFRPALTVTLLRTVVGSFVLGTFLSPGFILSFSGGCASITAAGVLQRVSDRIGWLRVSPIGLGIAGAFVHNMVQLGLAYLLLIHHPGIFFLVPWLSMGSVVLGALSGVLAVAVLNQLAAGRGELQVTVQPVAPLKDRVFQPACTWLHRCPAEIKIAAVLVVTLTTVLVEELALYLVLFSMIVLVIPTAKLSYTRVFQVIKRLWVIVLSAFLLPLYFNAGSRVLIDTPLISLHQEAVESAFIFSVRIILLALISSLVAQTTSTTDFTRGIHTWLRPLRSLGMRPARIADTLSQSLTALPDVWVEIRSVLSALLADRPKDIKTLKNVIVQLFCYIFAAENRRP
jgi:heptaprenyl diphosphate synthase